jgi:tRNA pseudouridine38-40 synthase
LEKAIHQLVGEAVRVKMAGRTDAGVHAKGQVASFITQADYHTDQFVNALNYYLPDDIAVKDAKDVAVSFDVRRHALARTYRYTIYNGSARSPLLSRTAWHVSQALDIVAMRQSASYLIGQHDFASFAPASEKSTWREVYRAAVCRHGDIATVDIEGNAFLRHQVRRTVGALTNVGLGRATIEQFKSLVDTPQRGFAGPTAPPHGLCLMAVRYHDMEFGWP